MNIQPPFDVNKGIEVCLLTGNKKRLAEIALRSFIEGRFKNWRYEGILDPSKSIESGGLALKSKHYMFTRKGNTRLFVGRKIK